MSTFDRNSAQRYGMAGGHADAASFDAGLRAYMLSVYNYMAVGLVITGLMAMAVAALATAPAGSPQAVAQIKSDLFLTEFGVMLYTSPLRWVVMLAPLGMVFLLGARVHKMSVSGAQMMFWTFAAIMGISLSSIFLVYTSSSIARVFFITAISFGGLSLYGYTTKKSLSGWGSFLMMGLIGIIVASIVNYFVGSSALHFAISVIGVLVFAGLTAYDTQRIKEMYAAVDSSDIAGKKAIMGALTLYLDFINMFMMLLSLFGNRD
ncbi:Bax inhibitor-1/YccA family protein [Polycladidibacter stylochi]|uniref:Bax inhibitor-1/YccA family protein n=1 Tax=Polycladidibacter stylochi TaxID=1807766 RepID=UPI0008379261|nr:Bax inhibitor-1/YccA family protein [Pseudovibrio stylochi]